MDNTEVKDPIIEGMLAASDAIFNQEMTMRDERAQAHVRITKLKETIANRILERCTLFTLHNTPLNVRATALAHSSSTPCNLEPGWDVVN